MPDIDNPARRRFIQTAAAGLAAFELGLTALPATASSSQVAALPATSGNKVLGTFKNIQQIRAGELNIGYVDVGPKNGEPVLRQPAVGSPDGQRWPSPHFLNGWHSASAQLQQLADKLNGLDEQRGKYMTVSQLKSSVFSIQQALNATPPVEESLRKLAAARQQNDQVPPQLVKQLDNQFVQLLSRYVLLAPQSDSPKAN